MWVQRGLYLNMLQPQIEWMTHSCTVHKSTLQVCVTWPQVELNNVMCRQILDLQILWLENLCKGSAEQITSEKT